MHVAMPVKSEEICMRLHMTTMELDARQGGAMALYGPKVAPPLVLIGVKLGWTQLY